MAPSWAQEPAPRGVDPAFATAKSMATGSMKFSLFLIIPETEEESPITQSGERGGLREVLAVRGSGLGLAGCAYPGRRHTLGCPLPPVRFGVLHLVLG